MKFYLLVCVISAAVTWVLAFAIWKLSAKFRLYPAIRERDVHSTPTPRLGGVAMLIGILTAFAVASQVSWFDLVFSDPGQIAAILGAAFIIVLIGVADDIWDLDWLTKLAGQIGAAGLLVWQGVQLVTVPIGGVTIVPPTLGLILTVGAVVLVMNAVNFVDGLDGLVAGIAIIANGAFFVYSYLLAREVGEAEYFNLASLITAVLIGACLGFLPLNWHPAKLFMGDSGALLVGMLMATSAISVTGQIDPSSLQSARILAPAFIPILLPLAILLIPLVDFVLAVVRRVRAGKSPFSADRKHLHHKLLDIGHSQLQAVLIFYLWTAVASVGVLSFLFLPSAWSIAFIVVGLALTTVLTLAPLGQRKRAAGKAGRAPRRTTTPVYARALFYGAIVTVGIALVGSVIGYLAAGVPGIYSALMGALLAAVFMGLTTASLLIAARVTRGSTPPDPRFFAIVIGTWLVKLALFLVIAIWLRGVAWLDPAVFSVAALVAVAGQLGADVVAFQTGREPYVDVTLPGDEADHATKGSGNS